MLRSRSRRLAAALLATLLALGAGVSCGEYVTGPAGGEDARAVRGLALATSLATLTEGDTLRPTVVALDRLGAAFATLPSGVVIAWSSADERIATVSADGLVTAVGVGTTRITARAANLDALPPVSMEVVVRFRARLVLPDTAMPRGVVGEALAPPVRVQVVDPDGAGLPGAVVRFIVRDPAGDSVATDVASGDDGVAALPLTFGSRPGAYTVEARLRDAPDVSVRIVAIAIAGAAAQVELVSGNGQVGVAGELLPLPLVVRVSDRFGNPVADSLVTFVPDAGSGSATPTSVATDASGLAATRWTLGPTAGAHRLVATQGALPPVLFAADAQAGAVARVVVTPEALAFATLGRSATLAATAADRFGNALPTQGIGWTSTATGVATVDAGGTVRAVGDGTALVIGTLGGVADTTVVTVRQVVATVQATPAELAMEVGATATVVATVTDSGGAPVAGATVAWRADDEAVATVDAAGLVRAVGAGATRLVASAGGVADTVAVTVTAVDNRRRVVVTPATATLPESVEDWFTARVYDANGVELQFVDLAWRSSDPSIARVTPNPEIWNVGIVEALAPGTVLIIATSGEAADTAVVTVVARVRRVTTIEVRPDRVTLAPEQSAQLTARALDELGEPIDGKTFTWRSSDEQVAVVSQAGVVTGVRAGTATITAEADGVTGTASSATIATCGPTGLSTFGTAMSLDAPLCVLRLNSGANQGSGGAWSTDKRRLVDGFDATFRFRISEPGNDGADGFAFIIQDVSGTYVGGGGGGIGYHGLPRSIAIEFDTWHNPPGEAGDPDDNHISVHTNGLGPNDVDERFSIGRIDASAMPYRLDDGLAHTVRVRYVPGMLELYLDGAATPALSIPVNLGNIDGAGGSIFDAQGRAWIGFTAATGFGWETHDILDWRVETP